MRLLAATALVLACTACYSPDLSTGLVCDEGQLCPEGTFCGPDNRCRFDDEIDAGVGIDGAIDAAVADIDAAPGAVCEASIPCPAPDSDKVTICGNLVDLSNGDFLRDKAPTGTACNPAAPAEDGPCALEVRFFDPLAFAADPVATPPLAADSVLLDDCGRYVGVNITRPSTGLISVVTNDSPMLDDDMVTVAFAVATAPGDRNTFLEGWALEGDVDETWIAQAGNPFGAGVTFGEKGAIMGIFRDNGSPVSGVTILEDGSAQPPEDFYFSDSVDHNRTTIDLSLKSTGLNGSVLMVDSPVTTHSGGGSERVGCEWSAQAAGSVPGVISVTVFDLVANGTSDSCP